MEELRSCNKYAQSYTVPCFNCGEFYAITEYELMHEEAVHHSICPICVITEGTYFDNNE